MKKTLLFLFMVLLCDTVKSQYPYYEDDRLRVGVQIGADYDSPLGKLGFTYKPTLSPNISLLFSKSQNFTMNITFGYHVYKPKASEFYYLTDEGENYGTATFSDYKVKSVYVGFWYDLPFTETLSGLAGLNFGAFYTDYDTTLLDRQQSSESNPGGQNVYIGPKLGVSLHLTESIACNVMAKYNVFAPTGRNDTFAPAIFHKDLGTLYTSWAAGMGLSYKF